MFWLKISGFDATNATGKSCDVSVKDSQVQWLRRRWDILRCVKVLAI